MRQTIAAACALCLATPAFSQAPQTIVSTHDARPLLRSFERPEPPHALPLHAAFADRRGGLEPGRVIDEDSLTRFLTEVTGVDGVEVGISGGQVFVKGPPEAHQKATDFMNHLSRTLLQEVTVEVYALQPGQDWPTGVLSPADVDRILAGKTPPIDLARTVVLVGQPGRVRAGKGTSFVSDYDVEVAQSAAISDPVVRVLQEGLDFQASVGQAADGRMLVKFGCTRCALAEALTARTVASTRLGDIQLPKVRSTMVAGSGLVEDGGALAARHDGGLGSGTLVRVRRAAPPPRPAAGIAHHVLFAEDLLGPPLRIPIPNVRDDQRKSGDEAEAVEPLTEPAEGAVENDVLRDLVTAAIGEDTETSFEVIGPRVHLRGSDATAAKVRDALALLAKGLAKNVVVDFRIGRIDTATHPLPKETDQLAASLTTAVSVPISLSDQFLVAGGLEQSAIIDQDVEIAQQSQIADPIVAPLFNGYVISGVVSASGSDRVELVLDLQHQELLPWPNAGFPSRAENVGPIDLPQVDATSGRHKLLLEPGRWTVVTVSNPGESSALVVVARAHW